MATLQNYPHYGKSKCPFVLYVSDAYYILRFCHTHTHALLLKNVKKMHDVTRHKALSKQEGRIEENGMNNSVNKISQNRGSSG